MILPAGPFPAREDLVQAEPVDPDANSWDIGPRDDAGSTGTANGARRRPAVFRGLADFKPSLVDWHHDLSMPGYVRSGLNEMYRRQKNRESSVTLSGELSAGFA